MPPRLVHLVRHAQGQHNVDWQHHIRDPVLTPAGHAQCAALAAAFPHHSSINHLLASPLKRTLQTALESFHPLVARLSSDTNWRIRCDPLFQETGEWQCDIGSSVPDLQSFLSDCATSAPETYGSHPLIDFSPVLAHPDWPAKHGFYAAANANDRAKAARSYLFENYASTDEIVVVSHGGFLHYLSEDWDSYDDAAGTAWANTEWRSYEMSDVGGRIKLVETPDSLLRRRGGGGKRAPAEETEAHEVEVGGHHRG
ncbi:hypothetical protein Dda_9067 [Drechslerella dactyloides]|uniref:Phosphoglycerate mutase family protein n=1 Tax=Drechslerella dactyloides TaxID=74499 RepID=A0AAD6IQ30_DREDA|nr:hypothetical protein Dda_9067 [Drechslerella dactyloides]